MGEKRLAQEIIEKDIRKAASCRECTITGHKCNKYDSKTAEEMKVWAEYIQQCAEKRSSDVFSVSDKQPEFVDTCSMCDIYKEYCQAQNPILCYKGYVSQKIRNFFANQK